MKSTGRGASPTRSRTSLRAEDAVRKGHGSGRFFRASNARPLVLGHRGARHAAPENTFAAFELARREGADGIELDVRLDGSGEAVVIHDVDLTRVTGNRRQERVEALSTQALLAVDLGGGERVPRLADALAWASEQDALINVEVKADVSDRRRLLTAVVSTLRATRGVSERVLLSSFHPLLVRALSLSLPEFPVCWLFHERQRSLVFARGFRALGAQGISLEHTLLSGATVRRFRQSGALVNTWTVNDPSLAASYASFGVDSIISDCPGALLKSLNLGSHCSGQAE